MSGLMVIEIFESLQGEGYWTGTPMTFVRLAGCNAPEAGLECVHWCDTPGSWGAHAGAELRAAEIMERVAMPRLCLTGGEPLLQAEGVLELTAEAHRRDVRVHLETNGTIDPPLRDGEPVFDWAVVSPKPEEYFIAPGWEGLVDELKLVVDDRMEAAIAERVAALHEEAVVSIQPLWKGEAGVAESQAAMARAVALVMDHPAWRLSLQIHKYLGLR